MNRARIAKRNSLKHLGYLSARCSKDMEKQTNMTDHFNRIILSDIWAITGIAQSRIRGRGTGEF
jgi:hypothetical protein